MNQWYESQADGDFLRARTLELLGRISDILTLSKHELLPLEDVLSILKPTNETYQGMQTVPIDLIVGSEGRYRDFNGHFLPRREHLRARWVKVNMAHYEDIILPPVKLYEIGGVYFVRDGNHRVSVAKLRGQMAIDAEVTRLSSEIGLKPGMSLEEMRQVLLAYEKRMFYLKTEYDLITGEQDLEFSTPGRFDTIYEHILVHKYFINQNQAEELDFGAALLSWHQNVYKPIVEAIRENGLLARFPGRTASDLYVFISAHWNELKAKYGIGFGIDEAALDFKEKFGSGYRERMAKSLRKLGATIRSFLRPRTLNGNRKKRT